MQCGVGGVAEILSNASCRAGRVRTPKCAASPAFWICCQAGRVRTPEHGASLAFQSLRTVNSLLIPKNVGL